MTLCYWGRATGASLVGGRDHSSSVASVWECCLSQRSPDPDGALRRDLRERESGRLSGAGTCVCVGWTEAAGLQRSHLHRPEAPAVLLQQ